MRHTDFVTWSLSACVLVDTYCTLIWSYDDNDDEEAGKWTKINSISRQALPEIYDMFSKKLDLTERLQKYLKIL